MFPTSYVDGFFEFRILGVDEIDLPQFSFVFQMEFFIRPLLPLLQLGVLSHCFRDFWPHMIWPGCKLFSRQSPPGPQRSFRRFSHKLCSETLPPALTMG